MSSHSISMKKDGNRGHRNNRLFSIIERIIPITGAISYELFSTKILIHKQFSAFFGNKDAAAADILWLNANICFGLYLYRQKLFKQFSTPWKITYSVFAASMFNFGSALLWGTTRTVLPEMPDSLRAMIGFGSGGILMFIGWSLIQDISKIGLENSKNGSVACKS